MTGKRPIFPVISSCHPPVFSRHFFLSSPPYLFYTPLDVNFGVFFIHTQPQKGHPETTIFDFFLKFGIALLLKTASGKNATIFRGIFPITIFPKLKISHHSFPSFFNAIFVRTAGCLVPRQHAAGMEGHLSERGVHLRVCITITNYQFYRLPSLSTYGLSCKKWNLFHQSVATFIAIVCSGIFFFNSYSETFIFQKVI